MLSSHCPRILNPEEVEFAELHVPSVGIRVIDKVRPCYTFLTKLLLDNNLLMSLNGIEQFQNLEVLSFNFNHVSQFSELGKVRNPFFIQQICMIGNPLQSDIKCQFQYLSQKVFVNLKFFNRLHRKANRKQWKLTPKKHEPSPIDHYEPTQRYAYHYENQLGNRSNPKQSTLRQLNEPDMVSYRQEIRNQARNKTYQNMTSTAVDKNYEQYSTKRNVSLNDEVLIRPFIGHPEETSLLRSSQYMEESFDSRDGQISSFVRSPSLHRRTGQFPEQNLMYEPSSNGGNLRYQDQNSMNLSSKTLNRHLSEQPSECSFNHNKTIIRSFASQFLQSQKKQIVIAFHNRSIKEKVFAALRRIRLVQANHQP